ncbi:MAG: hypothetical protein ACRDTW_18745 [Rhodococcus qingshengii]
MDAQDVPERMIPSSWTATQVVCAAFAVASIATGILVAVTTAQPISLGLIVFGVLALLTIPSKRLMGAYLVCGGAILLQLSVLSHSDSASYWSRDALFLTRSAYGIVGTAAVALGCLYCRLASPRS